jgi:hypothetical protein
MNCKTSVGGWARLFPLGKSSEGVPVNDQVKFVLKIGGAALIGLLLSSPATAEAAEKIECTLSKPSQFSYTKLSVDKVSPSEALVTFETSSGPISDSCVLVNDKADVTVIQCLAPHGQIDVIIKGDESYVEHLAFAKSGAVYQDQSSLECTQ